MTRLFNFLISGCWHYWEDTHQTAVADTTGTVIGYAVFCRCSKCGAHRRYDLF
jgi:hypothetical protein